MLHSQMLHPSSTNVPSFSHGPPIGLLEDIWFIAAARYGQARPVLGCGEIPGWWGCSGSPPCLPSRDARSALNWSKRFHSVPLAAAFSLFLGMSHHVSRRRPFRFELSSQGPGYPSARLGRRCALRTPHLSKARIGTGAQQRWLVSGPFPPVLCSLVSSPGRRGTYLCQKIPRCRGKGSSLAGLVLAPLPAPLHTVHPHRKDMGLPCANPHLRARRSACLSLSHTIQLFAPGEQGMGFVIHFGGACSVSNVHQDS
ncbi:hypothetical protein QBC41DRAFT_74609 [Cercophora samala]|uniref:Uncharacterized protein n=1 Tax=Cercophora samala TaxID=330535 RepID=A0AA39ZGD8_9PEZI|nr:hypothetical protein QBC41DRAFT_74609 [Cercophora samala]